MSQEAAENAPTPEPAADTSADAEPKMDNAGNPAEGMMVDEQIAQAWEQADAAEEERLAEQQKQIDELSGIATPSDEPAEEAPAEEPAEDEPAEAAPEAKPSKPEADDDEEPVDNIAAARYALRRDRRKLRAREREVAEQLKQAEAAQPILEIADKLRSGDTVAATEAIARLAGVSRGKLYLNELEAESAEGDEPKALDPEQIKAELRKEFEEQQRAAEQKQVESFLDSRVSELASIRSHDNLKKTFPYIGTLSEGKLVAEMAQSVNWAHENRRHDLLRDTPRFAQQLNTYFRQEMKEQLANLRQVDPDEFRVLLSECGFTPDGHGQSSKPEGDSGLSNRTADAAKRKTQPIDTPSRGANPGLADLEPEQLDEKIAAILGSDLGESA